MVPFVHWLFERSVPSVRSVPRVRSPRSTARALYQRGFSVRQLIQPLGLGGRGREIKRSGKSSLGFFREGNRGWRVLDR